MRVPDPALLGKGYKIAFYVRPEEAPEISHPPRASVARLRMVMVDDMRLSSGARSRDVKDHDNLMSSTNIK